MSEIIAQQYFEKGMPSLRVLQYVGFKQDIDLSNFPRLETVSVHEWNDDLRFAKNDLDLGCLNTVGMIDDLLFILTAFSSFAECVLGFVSDSGIRCIIIGRHQTDPSSIYLRGEMLLSVRSRVYHESGLELAVSPPFSSSQQ